MSTIIIVSGIVVSAVLSLASMGIFYVIRNKRLAAKHERRRLGSTRKCEFLIEADISNGRELNKIPAISYSQNDKTPVDFHYVNEHVCVNPIQVDTSLSRMNCCQCLDDCASADCECARLNRAGPHYDLEGRLSASYLTDTMSAIRECNVGCKCNRRLCKNMVIQGGAKMRFILFKTKSRGWGVRATEPILRGTFIGNYSGELITAESSTKRKDDTYLFNLSNNIVRTSERIRANQLAEQKELAEQEPSPSGEHRVPVEEQGENVETGDDEERKEELLNQGESRLRDNERESTEEQSLDTENATADCQPEEQFFICDAKHYGNFTRFINHSCEPNVIGVRTFTSHQDDRFPYISFFANKDIQVGEELTLNYGDNYWLVKCRRDHVYCLCKTPSCRFTKKTFQKTLKMHNEQVRAASQTNS